MSKIIGSEITSIEINYKLRKKLIIEHIAGVPFSPCDSPIYHKNVNILLYSAAKRVIVTNA